MLARWARVEPATAFKPSRFRNGLDLEVFFLLHHLDAALDRERERSLRALHRHRVSADRGADALRQIDGLSSNSRHDEFLKNSVRRN